MNNKNLFCPKNSYASRKCNSEPIEERVLEEISYLKKKPIPDKLLDNIYNDDLSKNDKLEFKLIKSLISSIYKYEMEIVEFEKSSENILNLNITGGVCLRRFKNSIVASEISKILGISLDTVKGWLHELELSNKPIKMEIRRTTFKKMREHIEIFSNHCKIYNSFSKVLSDYHESRYKKDFRDELLSIFNKYIKGGGGKSWLSKILGKSRAYIDDLESRRGDRGKEGPEHYAKYFNLLTNIHLLEKANLDFKEGFKIRDLKTECHNFIFREMKKRNMINELCESRYSKRIVNLDNRELFDIVVNSLLAFTKIERGKRDQNDNFSFEYVDLSRKISLTKSRDFFSGKFRNGFPLAKAEGRRLINEIRKGFFNAPEVCHNVIYRIKIHINKPRWRAYEMHFIDLRDIQRKELLDLSLGLDIFDKVFLKDAQPFVTKDGHIIDGTNVLYLTRHHLDEDQKYYLIFDYDDNNFKFKIILLASSSHWKVHGNKEDYNKKRELLNARMKHLYKLLQYPYIPNKIYSKIFKSEFNNKTGMIDGKDFRIWSNFSENIIDNWIERWQARKTLSDKEFYEKYYPNFYKERYKPLLRDMNLFKDKDSNCLQPEFWYWYFTHYLIENIYPSINIQ